MNYFDYLRHNRRYHPHGFTDHTKCKYNQQAEGGDLSHYHQFANADDSRKWLLENTAIDSCHIKDLRDFFGVFGSDERLAVEFRSFGKPVSEEVYDRDCIIFAQTCKGINDRFRKIPFPDTVFVPYDFNCFPRFRLGASTLDTRDQNESRYVSIGNISGGGKSAFGHSPNEFPYDVARHEIGHCLATKDVFDSYVRIKENWPVKELGNVIECLSRLVRQDSLGDPEEEIADLFSIRFSPAFSEGTMPDVLIRFADSMMIPNSEEGLTMDESVKHARSKKDLPYWYTVSVEPANEPPDAKFWWYDAYAGYVTFGNGREMAEYVFDKLQIPEDLQKRLFAEFKGKKWGRSEVGMVKGCYYDLGYSYDRIIEVVNSLQRGL